MKIFKKLIFLVLSIIMFSSSYIVLANDNIDINASAALLIDNRTNKILYSKNENEKLFPASTTKIITAILVIENYSLDEKVTASYDAIMNIPQGYATANIQVGEELTIKQLLDMLLVHSANDAANVLAEYAGGSISSFVAMMNTKINELGLTSTHFTNPYGLQDDNHFSTAHDLAVIMQYCLKNNTFKQLSGQASCAIPATNKSAPRKYASTNELLIAGNINYSPYVISGKTGFTSKAGGCLVSMAYHNDLELISVILNSNDRFGDTRKLYNYGYDNYSLKNIVNANDVITSIEIKNASKTPSKLDVLVSETVPVLAKNSDDLKNITPEIALNKNISAPITEGQTLGKVSYTVYGVTYTTDLIAESNIEANKISKYIFYIVGFLILILLTYRIFRKN